MCSKCCFYQDFLPISIEMFLREVCFESTTGERASGVIARYVFDQKRDLFEGRLPCEDIYYNSMLSVGLL